MTGHQAHEPPSALWFRPLLLLLLLCRTIATKVTDPFHLSVIFFLTVHVEEGSRRKLLGTKLLVIVDLVELVRKRSSFSHTESQLVSWTVILVEPRENIATRYSPLAVIIGEPIQP